MAILRSMLKTYFISGLGTDQHVFDRLNLDPSIEAHHLPWLVPEKNESIAHYAQRMLDGIENPEESALVGLSFGGMMAVEMNKLAAIKKTVLISSVKTVAEVPLLFRALGVLKIHRLAPTRLLMMDHPAVFYAFGVRTDAHRQRMREILDNTDPAVFRWSIDQVLTWKNTVEFPHIQHIHGTRDRLFPKQLITADHWIEGGPHFMVASQPGEVSRALNQCLLSKD